MRCPCAQAHLAPHIGLHEQTLSVFSQDSRRIHFLTREHCSELHKKWAYFTNLFFAVSTALFSLCLAVSPDESMVLHTFPFMFVILSLAMVSANYLHQERGGTKAYTVIVISFVILSVTKFLLTSIALITVGDVRVNPWVARVIDAAWTIGLMIAPFARPPSTDLGHKLESSEARQAAATQVVYWSWLFIFLIPYILVGTLLQMLSSLLGMGHFFPYLLRHMHVPERVADRQFYRIGSTDWKYRVLIARVWTEQVHEIL